MRLSIELDSYGLYDSSSGLTSFVSIVFSVVFDSNGSSVLIFFVSMTLSIELDSYSLYDSSSGSTSFVSIAFSVVFDSTGSSVLNLSTLSSSSSSLC